MEAEAKASPRHVFFSLNLVLASKELFIILYKHESITSVRLHLFQGRTLRHQKDETALRSPLPPTPIMAVWKWGTSGAPFGVQYWSQPWQSRPWVGIWGHYKGARCQNISGIAHSETFKHRVWGQHRRLSPVHICVAIADSIVSLLPTSSFVIPLQYKKPFLRVAFSSIAVGLLLTSTCTVLLVFFCSNLCTSKKYSIVSV